MTILHPIKNGYIMFCPGCQRGHGIFTSAPKPDGTGPVWEFDGNLSKPTFTPSVRIETVIPATSKDEEKAGRGQPYDSVPLVCHFNITDGNVVYHDDTTHRLRGKTIPMEEF